MTRFNYSKTWSLLLLLFPIRFNISKSNKSNLQTSVTLLPILFEEFC